MIENSRKDQAKRKHWEKVARSNRNDVRPEEILSLHGQVRHICISCQTAVLPSGSVKLCTPCYDALPEQQCGRCEEKFRAPFKREICNGCIRELREAAKQQERMPCRPL